MAWAQESGQKMRMCKCGLVRPGENDSTFKEDRGTHAHSIAHTTYHYTCI